MASNRPIRPSLKAFRHADLASVLDKPERIEDLRQACLAVLDDEEISRPVVLKAFPDLLADDGGPGIALIDGTGEVHRFETSRLAALELREVCDSLKKPISELLRPPRPSARPDNGRTRSARNPSGNGQHVNMPATFNQSWGEWQAGKRSTNIQVEAIRSLSKVLENEFPITSPKQLVARHIALRFGAMWSHVPGEAFEPRFIPPLMLIALGESCDCTDCFTDWLPNGAYRSEYLRWLLPVVHYAAGAGETTTWESVASANIVKGWRALTSRNETVSNSWRPQRDDPDEELAAFVLNLRQRVSGVGLLADLRPRLSAPTVAFDSNPAPAMDQQDAAGQIAASQDGTEGVVPLPVDAGRPLAPQPSSALSRLLNVGAQVAFEEEGRWQAERWLRIVEALPPPTEIEAIQHLELRLETADQLQDIFERHRFEAYKFAIYPVLAGAATGTILQAVSSKAGQRPGVLQAVLASATAVAGTSYSRAKGTAAGPSAWAVALLGSSFGPGLIPRAQSRRQRQVRRLAAAGLTATAIAIATRETKNWSKRASLDVDGEPEPGLSDASDLLIYNFEQAESTMWPLPCCLFQ